MSNIHLVNLSAYTQPEVVENPRNEWVELQCNDGGNYYQWLIDRYRNSPTNNSVINNMSRLIFGRGLYAKDASRRANDYAQMKVLFSTECLKSVITDFKIFGSGAFQIIYNKTRSKIVQVEHIPRNLLNPEKCNKDGEIEAYYYSDNWDDIKNFPPKRIACYTGEPKENIEILVFGNYSVGRKYFHSVDYEGALDYALLEQEIAQYLVNDVKNGFSGTKVINFNNGTPTEEQQREIVNKTMRKLTGSMGEKVIIAFNDSDANKTTVDDIPLNDAPEHYQYLSDEARNKILVAHSVTSPMLLGISPDGQGFSSNAEEIDTAAKYFHNTVIKHFQDAVIDAVDQILAFNNISLDLYFRRLNLFEDIDQDQQKQEEATALSAQLEDIISQYGEEDDLEGWELVDEREVNYDHEDELDNQLREHFKPHKSFLSRMWEFATGTASPNQKSAQDKEIDGFFFKVRYQYTGNPSPERNFCRAMMRASKVYRKEDIIKMGQQVVNAGFGEFGADVYSIWLYKGGARCNHKWVRRTYVSTSANSPLGARDTNEISTGKGRKFGYNPINEKEVSMKPNDMPLKGFSPNNPNLPSDVR